MACVDVEATRAHEIADEVGGVAVVGDATRRADATELFDAATSALDGLDGVVDIIGMARYASVLDVDDGDWDWQFDIVLRHAYLAVQLAGRRLAAGSGGVLAFVASVSGLTSAPNHAPYGAAKAGLMALVRSAAVELGPAGVRVNAVAPGVVWTPRVSAQLGQEGEERNIANTPLRRVAQPADIAAALLFLCSDLASYVTGQTLVVDGGVGARSSRTRWAADVGLPGARRPERVVRDRARARRPRAAASRRHPRGTLRHEALPGHGAGRAAAAPTWRSCSARSSTPPPGAWKGTTPGSPSTLSAGSPRATWGPAGTTTSRPCSSYADSKGWFDPATHAIRAHVEWAP